MDIKENKVIETREILEQEAVSKKTIDDNDIEHLPIGGGSEIIATSVGFLATMIDRLDASTTKILVIILGVSILIGSLNFNLGSIIAENTRYNQEYRMEQLKLERERINNEYLKLQLEQLRLDNGLSDR